jgi:alkanesulfonate monooxygenase SsuD/methylene tetrahydromethanopterin reductase-like flavin-dependent oxidoreductase (luciferase family)
LVLAIIGGEPHRYRSLLDLYREAGKRAGHAPEKLTVGVHNIGFVADETAQAADQHFPSYADAFGAIGRERGWGPVTRAQYDATRGATGALLVGDPEVVAEKIIYENEVLGGISRITVLLNGGAMPHRQVMHAIELLGTKVAPIVRRELAVPKKAMLAGPV